MKWEQILVSLSTLLSLSFADGDGATCDSAKEETVRSHLRSTIRSVWDDEILREQSEEVKALINNKFEEMKAHFQVRISIHI